ncbi:MAG TPA: hypothetical protein VJ912_02870, partial [Candidatus Nanoarchaeia archaeon]|nr:hypothetical protein [Candidatus Nanoarchaeia archaeon]
NLDYKNMQNDLQRSGGNNLGHFIHEGTITDVRDRETNTFYIKCQDKPGWNGDSGKQWANKNPYTLILHGTRPLLIDEATVNGKTNGTTIKNSTDNVGVNFKIKTSSGANNGEARCYYGTSEGSENIMFYNDGRQGFNHINEQKGLYLNEGNYTYYFECEDQGGNIAKTSLSFTIDVDTKAPEIIRAYKGDGSLRLTTSEEGDCVYSSSEERGCTYSYEEGIKMDKSLNSNVHMTDWNPEETFYVKCQDKYGNRALPGECSIIVRPFEI